MQVDLHNTVALVTGAARNIGKAIADTYAANGATVIYTDIESKKTIEAALFTEQCKAMTMDVSNADQVKEVIDEIIHQYARLDIVVNNAAVYSEKHRVTIDEYPQDVWEKIINVDLTGVFLVSKAASHFMIKQGSGRIINISSITGLVPLRLQCAYAAAKAGVVNLTKAMALELGPRGVLVNCIAPGSILTEATKRLFYGDDKGLSEKVKQMLSHIPLGRPGKPEDIANAALFLAAAESCYINGRCLTVDGGWTAGYTRDF